MLRNHFPWPIANLLHEDKKHLVLRNNCRMTKKFLITKVTVLSVGNFYKFWPLPPSLPHPFMDGPKGKDSLYILFKTSKKSYNHRALNSETKISPTLQFCNELYVQLDFRDVDATNFPVYFRSLQKLHIETIDLEPGYRNRQELQLNFYNVQQIYLDNLQVSIYFYTELIVTYILWVSNKFTQRELQQMEPILRAKVEIFFKSENFLNPFWKKKLK